MRASDAPVRYTRTAIALHWLVAILVIGQFAWGWWMQEIPKQPVGPRVDAVPEATQSVPVLVSTTGESRREMLVPTTFPLEGLVPLQVHPAGTAPAVSNAT